MGYGKLSQAATSDLNLSLQPQENGVRVILRDFGRQSALAEDVVDARLVDLAALPSSTPAELERLGRELSAIAFPPNVLRIIQNRIGSEIVRLRLDVGDPKWGELPWEYLWLDGHLALSPKTHLVRNVPQSVPTVLPAREQIRVLIVSADPASRAYGRLANAEHEVRSVLRALESPECRSLSVEVLRYATPNSLRQSLNDRPADVFHFIGHGAKGVLGGALLLEGSQPGEQHSLYGEELAEMLLEAGTRLVVLSGCLTAGFGTSVGVLLADAGIPAVVGMQRDIRDSAAQLFSRAMYAALSEGASIEDAVWQGRAAIAGSGPDWGAPVLMTRDSSLVLVSNLHGTQVRNEKPVLRHNLPVDASAFIGRAKERKDLAALIRRSKVRQVTVTGIGGMGKTRLARQVAADTLGDFQDGVWLVECEALGTREELIAAMAASLSIEESPVSEPLLTEALRSRKTLLVLDCFEGIVEHADLLSRLLSSCEHLRFLVTSRVLLKNPHEHEFDLEPMSLKRKTAGRLDGVELFAAAAARVNRDFKLDAKTRKDVEALIEDLEAVPLAILLAAGRLRHMDLKRLRAEVSTNRLAVLKSEPIRPEDRHATLRRVVQDSFELLPEADREFARSLSVFRGGFALEDAEALLGPGERVLDGIALLRDHSLLSSQLMNERMRFRVLDTIRDYLIESSKEADLEDLRKRHAEHFIEKSAEIHAMYQEGRWSEASSLLWLDIGNVRAAVKCATQLSDAQLLCRAARALDRPFYEVGLYSDFEELTAAAEIHAQKLGDLPLLIELRGLQGSMYRRSHDPERAQAFWLERADLCRAAGDVESEADSLLDLADLAVSLREFETVDQMLIRFTAISDRIGSVLLRASALLVAAKAKSAQGQHGFASEYARQAEALAVGIETDRHALFVWLTLARIHRSAGDLVASERLCRRLITEAAAGGYTHDVGLALLELSNVLEQRGDFREAAAAVAVAGHIPRSVPLSLREQIKQRTEGLLNSPHAEIMREAQQSTPRSAWSTVATRFVHPDRARRAEPGNPVVVADKTD